MLTIIMFLSILFAIFHILLDIIITFGQDILNGQKKVKVMGITTLSTENIEDVFIIITKYSFSLTKI